MLSLFGNSNILIFPFKLAMEFVKISLYFIHSESLILGLSTTKAAFQVCVIILCMNVFVYVYM